MKVRSYFPVTLNVDGEEIMLRVKRMTLNEFFDYNAMLARVGRPTAQRFTSQSVDTPDKHEHWLAELTPEKRAEYQAAANADEAEAKDFIVDVFSRFVTVERGLTEETPDGTERSITKGEDLLRVFGARQDVLGQVMEAVRRENTLDASQKKALKSRVASSPSSTAPKKARAGRKRATTARRAAKGDSADNGDATGGKNPRSGSTERGDAPSSPTPAPSLN